MDGANEELKHDEPIRRVWTIDGRMCIQEENGKHTKIVDDLFKVGRSVEKVALFHQMEHSTRI